MSNTYTAIFERDGDWHIAYCPEVPGANGLGHTKQEAQASLASAIELIFHDRRESPYRQGSAHSLWCNPATGAVETVPRHKLANS